jgi:phenylacetate-coenzyme A ligase PaaK-like adenylate-forming protein
MTARMGSSIDVGAHAMLRLDARTTLESLVTQLNAFKPDTLLAYPSSAALLAEEQLAGRLRITPRVVCTTSEVRTDDMEERIVAAWRQRPYNCYASSETGILAVDCDLHRGLHVLTDHTLVEVVDADDRVVPDGTQGHHLLVTSLLNRVQPIVRYRLDDLVTISPEPCPCGRPFPLIIGLDGRSDDLLRMPAGNGGTVVVHPLVLRSPLAGIAALRQYRMIHECGRLRVEIVARERGVATEVERRLRAALSAQHVVDVPIDVLEVASIARHAATGKFKADRSALIERAPACRQSAQGIAGPPPSASARSTVFASTALRELISSTCAAKSPRRTSRNSRKLIVPSP